MNEIQSKITCLTEKLMADYGKGRVIDEIKMFAYPDRNIIIDILEKLKIVSFLNIEFLLKTFLLLLKNLKSFLINTLLVLHASLYVLI